VYTEGFDYYFQWNEFQAMHQANTAIVLRKTQHSPFDSTVLAILRE
jgi:hypothetical protein